MAAIAVRATTPASSAALPAVRGKRRTSSQLRVACWLRPLGRTLLVAAASCLVIDVAHCDEPAPRAMMRLPRWIESIGEPGKTPRTDDSLRTSPGLGAEPAGSRTAPSQSAPIAPTAKAAPRAVPVATPTFTAEVRPAVVQAGPATTAAGPRSGKLPEEWAEIVPTAGPAATPKAGDAPGKTATSGETGGLKRWITDRVGALPKPLGKPVPAAADGEADAESVETVPAASPGPVASAETPAATAPAEKAAPQPTVTAPVAAVPDELPTLSIDPASFRGVHPGKTTAEELRAGWGAGEPFTREDSSRGFFWKIEPFERVEVTLDGDVVSAIRIKLAEPVAVGELAKQLEIADLRTVSILDEQGVSIGEVFPERGVIFSVKPGTQSATAVMIEPLDPESFVLRAEGEMDTVSAYAVADLQYAIEIDPRHLRAHRMLMVLMCEQGKWQQALALAEAAERIDPTDAWTRLKHAGILLALDRHEEARTAVESVKTITNAPPLVTAQAERLLGRIALAGPKPDHQKAVEHFAESIRRASTLLAKRSPAVQQAAREIMLDAHLGTAQAIAQGTWQQKSRVIPKWMARSEAVVAECKAEPDVQQTLELQLCRGALVVAAGSTESVEPLPWVKRLLEVRDRMGDTIKDPWRRREIDWEVGLGLLDALSAAQIRGDASDMLDNATLTAAYLERGGEHRELTDKERKNVGDLLFRIGIMHSLQRGDHATAVTWFDRVIPLWDGNPRLEQDGEAGQLGESYISMAISYWQVDRRDDAMALSRRGVDLMVAAVDAKQLEERALAVAYGNLATMYAEQGDESQSQTYAELASRAEASGTTLR